MKLNELNKAYIDFSATLSAQTRQLAIGGIGLAWLFKTSLSTNFSSENMTLIFFPEKLYYALSFFVLVLMLDYLQYVIQTAIWGIRHKIYDRRFGFGTQNKEEMETPEPHDCINWVPLICFVLKVAFTMVGFFNMGIFMINILLSS
ncbi:MAG: hypothetical protein WBW72_12115 [Erwinia billingiae]